MIKMKTEDLLEELSTKKKSCRKVVEFRMNESRSLDVICCVFEGKPSTLGGVLSLVRIQSPRR